MNAHRYTSFDPLLSEARAREMLTLCERFGSYGTYAEEPTLHPLSEEQFLVLSFLVLNF